MSSTAKRERRAAELEAIAAEARAGGLVEDAEAFERGAATVRAGGTFAIELDLDEGEDGEQAPHRG
jgi:hypothetical protein